MFPDPGSWGIMYGFATGRRTNLAFRLWRGFPDPGPKKSNPNVKNQQNFHHTSARGPSVRAARTFVHTGLANV